jgi:hypothetical protein
MPEPIRIAGAHESVEVDLWGALFYTQRITRTRQKALNALQQEIEQHAAQEDSADIEDARVDLYSKILDVILEPAEGKRKKASAHIAEKWQADDLTIPELESFIEALGEASRPT